MKHFIPAAMLLVLAACGEKEQTVVYPEAAEAQQATSSKQGNSSAPDSAKGAATSASSASSASSGSSGSSASSGSSEASVISGSGAMYTVKEGDTLAGIANKHDLSYRDLARWNNIKNLDLIVPAQQLRLSAP
jgi:LysM repeat protein